MYCSYRNCTEIEKKGIKEIRVIINMRMNKGCNLWVVFFIPHRLWKISGQVVIIIIRKRIKKMLAFITKKKLLENQYKLTFKKLGSRLL